MNSVNNVKHERHCINCDFTFTVDATIKEHVVCEKCAAGSYPTDYFEKQQNYYLSRPDIDDEDNAGWYALRDSIASYCGCHNAALCFEHNMNAPYNAACHTSTLQIACLDLNSFIQEKRYEELEDKLTSIENLLALPD